MYQTIDVIIPFKVASDTLIANAMHLSDQGFGVILVGPLPDSKTPKYNCIYSDIVGPGGKRIIGLYNSTADFIIFLDDDDQLNFNADLLRGYLNGDVAIDVMSWNGVYTSGRKRNTDAKFGVRMLKFSYQYMHQRIFFTGGFVFKRDLFPFNKIQPIDLDGIISDEDKLIELFILKSVKSYKHINEPLTLLGVSVGSLRKSKTEIIFASRKRIVELRFRHCENILELICLYFNFIKIEARIWKKKCKFLF